MALLKTRKDSSKNEKSTPYKLKISKILAVLVSNKTKDRVFSAIERCKMMAKTAFHFVILVNLSLQQLCNFRVCE
jgi:hypothetical protein